MGLFGLSRKEKEIWASIVIQGIKPGMRIDDALLKNATEIYISQHIRILEDSVRLVMESKNQKTRDERYDLSLQHTKLSEINTRFIERYYQSLLKRRAVINPLNKTSKNEFVSASTIREINKLLSVC